MIRFIRMVCMMKNPFHISDWANKLKAPWQFIGGWSFSRNIIKEWKNFDPRLP